jgi:hypothetical protein
MGESRNRLLNAMILMDAGRYKASADECVSSSILSLKTMLDSWNLTCLDSGCWEMLKEFGRYSPRLIPPWLRQCCKRLDRHDAFYKEMDGGADNRIFDEEYAMELINYGREVLKFAQRNLYREDAVDQS